MTFVQIRGIMKREIFLWVRILACAEYSEASAIQTIGIYEFITPQERRLSKE